MNYSKISRLKLLVALVIISAALFANPKSRARAQGEIPSPYDLIATVNQLRTNNGVSPLTADGVLMSSAQAHSEYQSFIGTWSHSGPGGSDETDRAIAAGYGGGQKVICDEAVAIANTTKSLDFVVFTLWDDYTHRDLVLLSTRYEHVGAGVAEKDGMIYYTVDLCIAGSGGSAPQPTTAGDSQTTAAAPTSKPVVGTTPTISQEIAPVITSTPNEDGSIYHVVEPGQAPWSIAIAYEMLIVDLATNNNISPSNPVVYAGQTLLIRGAFTPTITNTITNTPTRTPLPSRTPRPSRTTRPTTMPGTATVTQTATSKPLLPEIPALKNDRRTIGLVIIVVCGLGLLLVISASGSKGKDKN
jgi:hypothetical protein